MLIYENYLVIIIRVKPILSSYLECGTLIGDCCFRELVLWHWLRESL